MVLKKSADSTNFSSVNFSFTATLTIFGFERSLGYFKSLPKIIYPYKDKDNNQIFTTVPDIFRRVQLDRFFKNRNTLLDTFLNDGETPESVAHDYYGNTNYHWVVLLANDIVDVKREWPMSTENVIRYVKDKYGENNSLDVHHYVIKDTETIVDWDAAKVASGDYQAVTNLQYEEDINDKKRQIFLLDKRYLKDIIQQYKKLVK